MRTKYLMTAGVATVAALSLVSCSSKLRPYSADLVKVEPKPLELVGGKVPVTVNATFPSKWFKKKAELVVTPVLQYQGGEISGPSFEYQGEKVLGNARTISFEDGGVAKMNFAFDYKPAMQQSELFLALKGKAGNKVYDLPKVKVANGVVSTEGLASAQDASAAIAPDAFQRIIKEAHNANILFLIQQAEIRSKELGKSEVKDWNKVVKNANDAKNQNVTVEVQAYASPDGGLELNEKLSERREKNTTSTLKREFAKNKIKGVDVTANYTAQDWEGFKELVEKSNIQDKDLVLRVLQMYPDPETREKEIKNISVVFKQLADEILPQLRRSRLTANVEIIGKSDEEIQKLSKQNPKGLNVEELLYSATLTNDPAEQERIYKEAINIYPKDYRAYNNLGMLAYENADFQAANQWFNRANDVKPGNPETSMNLGLLALENGDKNKAMQLFGAAGDVPELKEARALLLLNQGKYQEAVEVFGNTKSNNAAIAQILNRDYNAAISTLNAVARPNATTSYLKAIIGARTNDASQVINNLRTAVQLDRSMAKRAAKDLEFAKYMQDEAFKLIVR